MLRIVKSRKRLHKRNGFNSIATGVSLAHLRQQEFFMHGV